MNQNVIIGLVAVVLLGGGAYFIMGNNTNSGGDTGGTDDATGLSGTMSQLIASGQNITCTFTQQEAGATVNGTVYLADKGERIRGNFEMSHQGQAMTGSVIRKDGTNYTWGDSPFGTFATKVAVDDKSGTDDSFDLDDEDIEYTCTPWRVDNSMFNLPAGVNFDDINAQVQQIDAAMEQVKDLKCSACDNIPDAAAQAQCRAAIGC